MRPRRAPWRTTPMSTRTAPPTRIASTTRSGRATPRPPSPRPRGGPTPPPRRRAAARPGTAGLRRDPVRATPIEPACPKQRSWPAWAAAIRPPWPNSDQASACSTSGPAAASTSSCRPAGSGPTGRAIGLDMTDEMLELARPQRRRGRRRQRRVRARHDRVDPAARRLDRRRDQQLRDQSRRGQGARCSRRSPGFSCRAAGSASATSSPTMR